MDDRPDWETRRPEPTGDEQGAAEGPTLRHDSPTIPGLPWQGSAFPSGADFKTQPAQGEPGRFASQPEWPLSQPGDRSRTMAPSSSTPRPGYCFGITIVSMLGIALVLALIAGTLFAVHTFGSSPAVGEHGVSAAASRTANAPTTTTHPAQPSPTALPTVTPTATIAPTPIPAQLSVSPLEETGKCLLGRYGDLTLKNSGGSDLTWSATTSDASIKLDPASGTLAAGATQTVTVKGIDIGKSSFTVTFTGNGGDATVTVTCS